MSCRLIAWAALQKANGSLIHSGIFGLPFPYFPALFFCKGTSVSFDWSCGFFILPNDTNLYEKIGC